MVKYATLRQACRPSLLSHAYIVSDRCCECDPRVNVTPPHPPAPVRGIMAGRHVQLNMAWIIEELASWKHWVNRSVCREKQEYRSLVCDVWISVHISGVWIFLNVLISMLSGSGGLCTHSWPFWRGVQSVFKLLKIIGCEMWTMTLTLFHSTEGLRFVLWVSCCSVSVEERGGRPT